MWFNWFAKFRREVKQEDASKKAIFMDKHLSNKYLREALEDMQQISVRSGKVQGKGLYNNKKISQICKLVLYRAWQNLYSYNYINSLAKIYDNYFSIKGLRNHKIIDNWTSKNTSLNKQLKLKFNDYLTQQLENKVNTTVIENNDVFSWAFYDIENKKKIDNLEQLTREYWVNKIKFLNDNMEKKLNIEENERNLLKYKFIRFLWKWLKILFLYLKQSFNSGQSFLTIILNKPQYMSDKVILKPSILMSFSAKARKDILNTYMLNFYQDIYIVEKDMYYLTPQKVQELRNWDYIFLPNSLKERIKDLARKSNRLYENHVKNIRDINEMNWQIDIDYINKLDINKSVHKLDWHIYKKILMKKKDDNLMEYILGKKASLRMKKMFKRLNSIYYDEKLNYKFKMYPLLSPLEKTQFKFIDFFKKLPFFRVVFAMDKDEPTKLDYLISELKANYIDSDKLKSWYYKKGKDILKQQDVLRQQRKQQLRNFINAKNISTEERNKRLEALGLKKPKTYAEKLQDIDITLKRLKEKDVIDTDLDFIGTMLRDEAKGHIPTPEENEEYFEGDLQYYKRMRNSHLYRVYRNQKNKWKNFLKLRTNVKDIEYILARFNTAQLRGIDDEFKQHRDFFKDISKFNNISSILNSLNVLDLPKKYIRSQRDSLRFKNQVVMQREKKLKDEKKPIPKVKLPPLYKRIFRYVFRKVCSSIRNMRFIKK